MRFSRVESFQILVAMAVLTLAFTFSSVGGVGGVTTLVEVGEFPLLGIFVLASLIAVVTAFLLHELAHKVVAQRYGCFAEFRYYPLGLFFAIVTGLLGFLFAAPGAVMIAGPVSARQNERISAAGPGTNLVIAAGFIALSVGLGFSGGELATFASIVVGTIAFVNIFLGGFNLVPFPPLDGSKIFASNKVMWGAMVAALVAVYLVGSSLQVF